MELKTSLKELSWSEINPSIFPVELTPRFRTHYNYSDFMRKKSEGLEFSFIRKIKGVSFEFKEECNKKIRLIKCFKKSLDNEHASIQGCEEFAQFNNTWIATKGYYLLFHSWCVLFSIINDNKQFLNHGHLGIINLIKKAIEEGNLNLNKIEFKNLHSYSSLGLKKGKPGKHLCEDYDEQEILNFLIRKIAEYKLEDFKRREGMKSFMGKTNIGKRDKFKSSEKISLIEFFYMYRIKTDYKDIDYLEESDYVPLHKAYYENYYNLTCNFFEALKKIINDLSMRRYNVKILK